MPLYKKVAFCRIDNPGIMVRHDCPISISSKCTDEQLVRKFCHEPEKWRVMPNASRIEQFNKKPNGQTRVTPNQRPVIQGEALNIPDDDRVKVAILSMGGMGDDLVKLNMARQLRPVLERKLGPIQLTWVGRQKYSIFDLFDFIDRWEIRGPYEHVSKLSPLIVDKFNYTFDSRYIVEVLTPGQRWSTDPLEGYDEDRFVSKVLTDSLPAKFKYIDDGQGLRWYLEKSTILGKENRLIKGIPKKYIVMANGNDPSFTGRLVKAMAPSTMYDICDRLSHEGISTVQVGVEGVDFVQAPGAIDMIGKTTMEGVIHLIKSSVGVVACEGGIAHLASQLRIPTAVLFGATSRDFWGYPGNLNLIADKVDCPLQPCWFREDNFNWHLKCKASEDGLFDLVRTYPRCMAMFKGHDVAEQFLEYLTSREEDDTNVEDRQSPEGKEKGLQAIVPRLLRAVSKHPKLVVSEFRHCHLVTPGVYLGGYKSAKSEKELRELGITAVINVCDAPVVKPYSNMIEYHYMPLIDGLGNPDYALEEPAAILASLLASGDKVLVHCRAGVSRSATVVAIFMVREHLAETFDEAISMIQRSRAIVDPCGALRTQSGRLLDA